ncbi:type II toxin-antitoxin system RelE family toxin [Salinicoccus sp. HZC-1]|uniref:type II toxin-antitoxin system RelE family toxin n=1 Tax=Salinicoccus sp. HZC-1 TaxID=3385497 RepID=UPI00398B967F
MMYRVAYEKKAVKSLTEIDKSQQRMIVPWIEKNLQNAPPLQFPEKKQAGTWL